MRFKRFVQNQYYMEKVNTLVNFPLRGLEILDFKKQATKYRLFGNIIHDGKPGEGSYRTQFKSACGENWYEVSDLNV